MQQISIELKIANRTYPLQIQAEEAETARMAAELINQKLKVFEERYGVRDVQDLFAMVSLQIATQLLEFEKQSKHYHSGIQSRLETLNTELDAALKV